MGLPLLPIISLATMLVQLAEGIFSSKPKSGEEKKNLVVQGLNAVVNAGVQMSTGGQKHTWEQVQINVGPLVDAIAGALYPSDDEGSFINKTTQLGG